MFFLLRTAFWLTLVLMLIPIGMGKESTSDETVDPVSAFLAAQATMSDIGGFCARNQQACETGGSALSAIGSRARDGAKIVYEYLDEKVGGDIGDDVLVTGSTGSQLTQHSRRAPAPVLQPSINGTTTDLSSFGPLPRPKPRSDTQF